MSTNPRRWSALVFIALAQLMVVLDATVVNIALPAAQRSLDLSDNGRLWVITGYSLASAACCSSPDAWRTSSAASAPS